MVQSSLIISVYKNTTFLKTVLDSVAAQSVPPAEVIISEDGSDADMAAFIQSYPFSCPMQHLTQEDQGWRKNKALNEAIRRSRYPYLIFIDGDCVLHPKFVEHHQDLAHDKRILAGKRVKLGEQYSLQLMQGEVNTFAQQYLQHYKAIRHDGGKFCEEGIVVPKNCVSIWLIRQLGISSIKGCNFSCYKEALEAINGFDEDYTLPAIGEDIDLVWRFKGLGYQISSIKHLAIQYHLHHRESWTDQSHNEQLMQHNIKQQTYRCINGLYKY